jgi:hypothetical protein
MVGIAEGTIISRNENSFPFISGTAQCETYIKSDPGGRAV